MGRFVSRVVSLREGGPNTALGKMNLTGSSGLAQPEEQLGIENRGVGGFPPIARVFKYKNARGAPHREAEAHKPKNKFVGVGNLTPLLWGKRRLPPGAVAKAERRGAWGL